MCVCVFGVYSVFGVYGVYGVYCVRECIVCVSVLCACVYCVHVCVVCVCVLCVCRDVPTVVGSGRHRPPLR